MSTKACNQPDGPPCSHALVLRMFWFYLEERRQRPESRRLTDASSLRTFISLSLLLLFPRKLSPIGCSSAKPVASASASVHIQASRADRKSQVRQCLGFCTADFLFSLSYKSAEQKNPNIAQVETSYQLCSHLPPIRGFPTRFHHRRHCFVVFSQVA